MSWQMARCGRWKDCDFTCVFSFYLRGKRGIWMIINLAKEKTELTELTFTLPTSFNYPLGSVISKLCFKHALQTGRRKAKDKSSEERDSERKLYWLWVSRSFLQNSGSNKGRGRVCLGRVMAVHSKGRVTTLWWPLQRSTSMDDESSGSVTHGAVGQEPALARLGIVQEREVHFIARLPQLGCGLQNREQGRASV